MKIPEELKTRLVSELDYIISKIREEKDPKSKNYFFSAAHGCVERTMRYHPSDELLVAQLVLHFCYSMLLDRINRVEGGDVTVPLPKDWSEQLIEYLSALTKLIEKNQSLYPALEKIVRLAYSVTGPGYYTMSYFKSLKLV